MTDDDTAFREASGILKLFALGAHQPRPGSVRDQALRHAAQDSAPAPAPPAILAYLNLANKLSVSWDTIHYMKPPTATPPSLAPGASSAEWDAEWMRGLHLADTSKPFGATFAGAFVPGSLEGVWEGLFTNLLRTLRCSRCDGNRRPTLHRPPRRTSLLRIHALGASQRSAGKPYIKAVNWKQTQPIPSAVREMIVQECKPEHFQDCAVVFSGLDADVAGDIGMSHSR
ncbi:hypothetical protein NUW54_g13234 [Trametes sanguinea]|uniref:Uncharacterized protein n=1 Tax=Trametes sanguinea TaxID=158606 RepID=A0ACC1MNZ4_9APHY|nr:hypothetical protein NUW54_g13234 [Trametes sanguinea]